MYLVYGSYNFGASVARIDSITRRRKLTDAGIVYGYVEQWRVSGELQAASQADLTTAIQALEAAHAIQGQSLGLYDDNSAATAHGVYDYQTLGGVRVVDGPSYPKGDGAEYSTYRTFEITYEWDINYAIVGMIAWSEQLSFDGGGPLIGHMLSINGPPQKQILAQATPYHAVQSGTAVGHTSYPVPPSPLWPADLKTNPRATKKAPKRFGNSFVEYEISWEYEFESAVPLLGIPTPQPNL